MHPRFKTPVNALLSGAVVTVLFVLLVFASPTHNVHILWFTYPANTNVLVSLVSFGVSGIYLSFFLTVIGAGVAPGARLGAGGQVPARQWAWPVIIVAGALPAGHADQRGRADRAELAARRYFNLDWITLIVMIIVFIVGAVLFALARGGREIDRAPARRRGEARRVR